MAANQKVRGQQEKGMLDNIGGRDEPSPGSAAPSTSAQSTSAPMGWMVYVGAVLWAILFCGVVLVAWTIFAGGG